MSPIAKLDNANIRSIDMYSGDQVNGYLAGDISKQQLKKELTRRRKEMMEGVKCIDKLLEILKTCPSELLKES